MLIVVKRKTKTVLVFYFVSCCKLCWEDLVRTTAALFVFWKRSISEGVSISYCCRNNNLSLLGAKTNNFCGRTLTNCGSSTLAQYWKLLPQLVSHKNMAKRTKNTKTNLFVTPWSQRTTKDTQRNLTI